MQVDEKSLRQIVESPLAQETVKMLMMALSNQKEGLTVSMDDGTERKLGGVLDTLRFLRERFNWRP